MDETSSQNLEPSGRSGLHWGTVAKAVPATVLTIVAVVFAIQNLDGIDVDFLAWGFDLPLVVIMVGSAAIGAALWETGRRLRIRRRAGDRSPTG